MMIHAYDKIYLEQARTSLGRMLDFAVHDMKQDTAVFFEHFTQSEVGERFGNGDSSIVAGKSGVELARMVMEEVGGALRRAKPRYTVNRSREYWAGHALAYYQWRTGLPFREITKYVPIDRIVDLYTPYHEMDIRQFAEKMDELYRGAKPTTNLKLMRKRLGLSQKELAEQSGISIRTVQQYEQRQKNINKASAEYIICLSKTLHCDVEDILEITLL